MGGRFSVGRGAALITALAAVWAAGSYLSEASEGGGWASLVLPSEAWAAERGDTPAVPRGRTPGPISENVYPASYFPNTELLAPDEMRITALGTGMPNQTKAAVSISYLHRTGKRRRSSSSIWGWARWGTYSLFGRTSRSWTRSSSVTFT